MASFITVDRKILKWEWYQDVKVFHLFLYFLLRANWEDGRWKGIEVKRGQLITGRLQLSKDTGLSEMEIRTCRKKLIATGEITVKVTNKYSIITICKYNTYQNKYDQSNQQNNQQNNQQVTSNQPTSNQQVTTNNNSINNNKEEVTSITKDNAALSENLIVPEMFKKFKNQLKDYPAFVENDFKPLFSIAKFLNNQLGLNGNPTLNQSQIVSEWQKICVVISNDNFYRTKTLSTISNQIQEIYQIHKNGTKKHNGGIKSNGGQLASNAIVKSDKPFNTSL